MMKLEIPALRVGNEKVAEYLDTRHCLEFFRIDEKGIERECVGLAEQLHQPAVFLDQIVGQHRDTQTTLTRAQYAEHVVDAEAGHARRTLAFTSSRSQRRLEKCAGTAPPSRMMR